MQKKIMSVLVAFITTISLHADYKILSSSFEKNPELINDSNLQTVATSTHPSHFIIIDQLKPFTVTKILLHFKKEAVASECQVFFGEDPENFGLASKVIKINEQDPVVHLGKGVGGRYIRLDFKSKNAVSIKEIKLNLLQKRTYGYSSQAGFRQARSVHIAFRHPPADAIYIEAKPILAPDGTYFCQLGFNGGYFGIQKLGNGHKVAIFSIWDGSSNNSQHTTQELRANAIFAKKGVHVQRFGGEGSGIKSMMPYDWKLNEYSAYMVTVSPTDQPNRNIYTAFLQNPKTKKWFRMASFNAIGANKLKGVYSFVEDFKRNYKSYNLKHKTAYKNPWYYNKKENKWNPVENLYFTADSAVSVNINANLKGDEAYLETGGKTVNRLKVFSGANNKKISKTAPKIDFELFPKK